jgi:hypothetical protein
MLPCTNATLSMLLAALLFAFLIASRGARTIARPPSLPRQREVALFLAQKCDRAIVQRLLQRARWPAAVRVLIHGDRQASSCAVAVLIHPEVDIAQHWDSSALALMEGATGPVIWSHYVPACNRMEQWWPASQLPLRCPRLVLPLMQTEVPDYRVLIGSPRLVATAANAWFDDFFCGPVIMSKLPAVSLVRPSHVFATDSRSGIGISGVLRCQGAVSVSVLAGLLDPATSTPLLETLLAREPATLLLPPERRVLE